MVMNWKDYPAEPCAKCGKESSEVYTKSKRSNWVYDGELARCKQCGHTGSIGVEDSECADIIWDEVEESKVKAVEYINPFGTKESILSNGDGEKVKDWIVRANNWQLFETMKSHITKLEARNKELEEALIRISKRLPENMSDFSKGEIRKQIAEQALNKK